MRHCDEERRSAAWPTTSMWTCSMFWRVFPSKSDEPQKGEINQGFVNPGFPVGRLQTTLTWCFGLVVWIWIPLALVDGNWETTPDSNSPIQDTNWREAEGLSRFDSFGRHHSRLPFSHLIHYMRPFDHLVFRFGPLLV